MFDPPLRLPRGTLRPLDDKAWRRKAGAVMKRFQRTFPDIVYDIAWEVEALNGVAWREVSQPRVRLYGGLLRHRAIGPEGVAVLFAHETGHHKGGAPYDGIFTWMSCERQADFWAARFGVPTAWADDALEAKRQLLEGARQLLRLETSVNKLRSEQYESEGRPRKMEYGDYPTPFERFAIFEDALTATRCT